MSSSDEPQAAAYFDAASGLPLAAVAAQAWQAACVDGWADPLSSSPAGRRSRLLLDAARATLAAELGVAPDEVVLLGSPAAALHAAVLGALAARPGALLTHSSVEHSAVFAAARWYRDRGGAVRELGVDALGRLDSNALAALPHGTVAVVQAANHEVGTRQPIAGLVTQAAARAVTLVCDARHAVLYDEALPAAPVVLLDPRLWGAPAGVGVLVVRRGARWQPPFPVDEAEDHRAPGGVAVPTAVAAAAALRTWRRTAVQDGARLRAMVDQLREAIPDAIQDCAVLGEPHDRLPHVLTVSCLYADGQSVLDGLAARGFTVSSGSSCTSDALEPSHVLVAMGALTSGNVRVSLHPGVTDEAVREFVPALAATVADVRAHLPGVQGAVQVAGTGTAAPALVVDSRGRRCPLPILDLARSFGSVAVGDSVTVLADDPAAASDIAAWCRMRGHTLVSTGPADGGGQAYVVRRDKISR